MLFNSQVFLYFFVAVFTAYWVLPWHRARVWVLLGASYYFYSRWNSTLACLVAGSSFMDYLIGMGLHKGRSPACRRLLLGTSLAMNLGLLAYFKYANFFLQSLQDALHAVGASASFPVLRILAPVGISFYTFEAINYTVDVYRGRIRAETNVAHFMTFILFFPHLLAGPIVRAGDFLPQLRRPKHWSWLRLELGVQLFLLGLVKKVVIADRMAAFVDPVFADPASFKSAAIWRAVLAYALQVYGDFSGYSDMAIGTAHLLGYKLGRNFDRPFLAPNIADFWRRWHMSLSSWLRDYVFIPLGGSRGGLMKTCRNLLIVMTLGGLWHGANWNFVLWGVFFGFMLVGHRHFRLTVERLPRVNRLLQTPPGHVVRVAVTFLAFCTGLTIFRAPGIPAAGVMLKGLFRSPGTETPLVYQPALLYAAVLVGLCHAGALWKPLQKLAAKVPSPLAGFGYAAAMTLVMVFAPVSEKLFIYFQF